MASDYIKKMRARIGQDIFIHPAARIIMENDQKEILVIERTDNGQIGLPAGSIEEGETIEECIKREVWEETGMTILELEVIGISSHPTRETVVYPNGDRIQYFTIEFYSNRWVGNRTIQDRSEIKNVKFMDLSSLEALPKNERSALESWSYYKQHHKILLK